MIKGDDREWNTLTTLNTKVPICIDDNTFVQRKWIMFAREGDVSQSMRLAENCPSLVTNASSLLKDGSLYECGAVYRGWIEGSHPTSHEGLLV